MLLCYAKCPPIQAFFCKKVRITGSLQFLHCVVSHISQLSKVTLFRLRRHFTSWVRSCMNINVKKLVRVLSFSLRCQLSPCHSIYLAIISIFALILAYFDRSCHKSANCGCICSIWRWVCLSESTCVQSDSTLRRNPTVS